MNLAVDDEKISVGPLPGRRPGDVPERGFGEKIDAIGRDMKYGVTIYQTVVDSQGQVVRDRGRRGRDAGGEGPRH